MVDESIFTNFENQILNNTAWEEKGGKDAFTLYLILCGAVYIYAIPYSITVANSS